jgi:hydroxymethylbilane synthase
LLRAARPDLEIVPLRGNVPTRIARIESDGLDGVILAAAGLDRLDLSTRISERISSDLLLPAVCQGTLALEARAGEVLADDLAQLGTPAIAASAAAERGVLCGLAGDCTTPLAAFAEPRDDGSLRLRGLVASSDGARIVRGEIEGPCLRAGELGRELAADLLARGADALLDELRAESAQANGDGTDGA